jgi:hypothetical protein
MSKPVYSSKLFQWHASSKTLSSDASELGWLPGQVPGVIGIKSAKTSSIAVFVLEGVDSGYFTYYSEDPYIGCKVSVFND